MSNSYSVSLQVRHPDADPEDIVAGLGLPPLRYWKAGDLRTTPKGGILDGKHRTTYCVFDLGGADGDGKELCTFLGEILVELEIRAAFVRQLRQTGGKVSFFILWRRVTIVESHSTSSFFRTWPASVSISAFNRCSE